MYGMNQWNDFTIGMKKYQFQYLINEIKIKNKISNYNNNKPLSPIPTT